MPNPSIERTSNGGALCLAPSRLVAPLAAAHVKRYGAEGEAQNRHAAEGWAELIGRRSASACVESLLSPAAVSTGRIQCPARFVYKHRCAV